MTATAHGYANVPTMDVVLTALNPRLPVYHICAESYAEFVQLAKKAGYPTTSLGYSWEDPQIDLDEVEMELYPNAYAARCGW